MDNSDDKMAQKLAAASKQMERAKAERQARTVKGSHLTARLLEMVGEAGLQMSTDRPAGFFKVTAEGRVGKLYIQKKGGRVDLAFDLPEQVGVNHLTAEEARARHLGRISAQLDFDQPDETVLAAFAAALAHVAQSPEAALRLPARVKAKAVAAPSEGPDVPASTPTEEPAQEAEPDVAAG